MLLQLYTYVKPRSAFGKQCVFGASGPVAVEDVYPEPEYFNKYIFRKRINRGVHSCSQLAAHDVQTIKVPTKNTSLLHVEGGWTKEINPKDEEIVKRFRRRVEKDDSWSPHMINLMGLTENCIRQNNAINIYQDYFNDLIPAHLVENYDVRTNTVYDDPQTFPRPISHLSWSPGSNRIAASYAFSELELEMQQSRVSLLSYIWDLANPNKPYLSLKPDSPVLAIEFNPRDPSMLVSGLMTGQVCNWDLRVGDKPVQVSILLHSHRRPTNQVAWTTSKCNSEFFSSSPCGMIKWWDVRKLVTPTETLIMDLDQPTRRDITQAVGVTAIQFEPALGSKFLAGFQNGTAISANRKAHSLTEKIAVRFDCHYGPVIAIERNPFNLMTFLTIGDWCAKVWADDTKEGSLVSACRIRGDVSGGCWSRSRHSVFFTINTEGLLEVHDILAATQAPLITFSVCRDSLTTIAPHENGRLLAVGNQAGGIHLIECTEALTNNSRADKVALATFYERESRFAKLVDTRMKEARLMYKSVENMEPTKSLSPMRAREKREKERRRSKESEKSKRSRDSEKLKGKEMGKEGGGKREKSEIQKKRHKSRKSGKSVVPFAHDPELLGIEEEFMNVVQEAATQYAEFHGSDKEIAMNWLQEKEDKKRQEEEEEAAAAAAIRVPKKKERKAVKAEKSKKRIRSRSVVRTRKKGSDEELIEAAASEAEAPKSKKKVKHHKHLETCPMKTCDPAICCMDMKGVRDTKTIKVTDLEEEESTVAKSGSKVRPFFIKEKWFRRLSDFIKSIPERAPAHKNQVLLAKNAPPRFLQDEVKRAKKHMVVWQRKLALGKRASWIREPRPSRLLRQIYEESPVLEAKCEETPQESMISLEERTPTTSKISKLFKGHKRRGKRSSPSIDEEVDVRGRISVLDWTVAQKIDATDKKDLEGDSVIYPRISAAFQPKIIEIRPSKVQISPQ